MRETQAHADDAVKPPRRCPACGQDLGDYPYYEFHPTPLSRRLQALAAYLLPVTWIAFVVLFFAGGLPPGHSRFTDYFILFCICALLIYAASMVIPQDHRVICLHCSWYQDYPYRWGLFEAQPPDETSAADRS